MLNKFKVLFQYYKMRWFSSPETFIKWYLDKKYGSFKLPDGTWVVNQSDDFHTYCYDEGYKAWIKTNKTDSYSDINKCQCQNFLI